YISPSTIILYHIQEKFQEERYSFAVDKLRSLVYSTDEFDRQAVKNKDETVERRLSKISPGDSGTTRAFPGSVVRMGSSPRGRGSAQPGLYFWNHGRRERARRRPGESDENDRHRR